MATQQGADDLVLTSCDNAIMTITFNRPEKKNALNHAMYTAIVANLREAEADPTIRAVCFRGAGPCFTSGNDLKDFLGDPPTGEDSPVMQLLHALVDMQKPLVAATHGVAIGIGATMTLHCDLVYAAASTVFQMPFTRLALCPEAASSYLLPQRIGMPRAAAMLLLGESVSAEKASQWGLVTEVLEDAHFEDTLHQRLKALAALPPEAVRTAKALMRAPLRDAAHDAIRREASMFMQRLMSAEAAEAMQAFLERRPPDFSRF